MGGILLVMLKWSIALALLPLVLTFLLMGKVSGALKRRPHILTAGIRPAGAMPIISWCMEQVEKICVFILKGFRWYFHRYHPGLFAEIAHLFPP